MLHFSKHQVGCMQHNTAVCLLTKTALCCDTPLRQHSICSARRPCLTIVFLTAVCVVKITR